MRKYLISMLLFAAVAMGFTACGGDDEISEPNNAAQNEQNAPNGDNNQSGDNSSQSEENGQQKPDEVVVEDIIVNVDAEGKADGGHSFYLYGMNCTIDGIKYDIDQDNNLVVSTGNYNGGYYAGYAGTEANIISQLNYNGQQMKVVKIASMAFGGCDKLVSVSIPNSVTSIGSYAFDGCTALTSVAIGNRVTTIGQGAFKLCSALTSITLPNSLTAIEGAAFSHCSSLTSIFIPKSLTDIGNAAFSGCSGLTSIVVDEENAKYDSRDGCNAIIETKTNVLKSGCKNTIIPNSVTSIGTYAFEGCQSLTSIMIPNSVTGISRGAFSVCTGLTSITLSEGLKGIGEQAFSNCSALTAIQLPESVIGISYSAFYGCTALASITIPNSTIDIGLNAFEETKWYNSQPSGMVYAGKVAYKYKGTMPIHTNLVIKDGTRGIACYAFSGCSSLSSITLPESITYIGEKAFRGCSDLTEFYCHAKSVPETKYKDAFSDTDIASATLHVPTESIDAYRNTSPWNGFGSIVALPE